MSRNHGLRLGALALVAAGLAACGEASAQEDWRTFNSSRQFGGEERLGVTIEYGAGSLQLGPASGDALYTATVQYDAGVFTPRVDYAHNRLAVGIEGRSGSGRNMRSGELDLRLTPRVPLDLDLKFGAADATLDLAGLQVRRLDVQTGASRTQLNVGALNPVTCESATVHVGAARFEAVGLGNLNAENLMVRGGVGEVVLDFTGAWQRAMDARVEMGLGSLTLRLPEGLPVRITRTGRLSSFDSEGLTKRGEHYYSGNWTDQGPNLTLRLESALGSVRVAWVDAR